MTKTKAHFIMEALKKILNFGFWPNSGGGATLSQLSIVTFLKLNVVQKGKNSPKGINEFVWQRGKDMDIFVFIHI